MLALTLEKALNELQRWRAGCVFRSPHGNCLLALDAHAACNTCDIVQHLHI